MSILVTEALPTSNFHFDNRHNRVAKNALLSRSVKTFNKSPNGISLRALAPFFYACSLYTLVFTFFSLASRRDEASSKTGMDLIIQFIAQLLDPSQTESASLFVGDLISVLIKKGGDLINSILPELLNAVTVRLTDAKLPSFIQVGAQCLFQKDEELHQYINGTLNSILRCRL